MFIGRELNIFILIF